MIYSYKNDGGVFLYVRRILRDLLISSNVTRFAFVSVRDYVKEAKKNKDYRGVNFDFSDYRKLKIILNNKNEEELKKYLDVEMLKMGFKYYKDIPEEKYELILEEMKE